MKDEGGQDVEAGDGENVVDLRSRTKQFALRVVRLFGSLPRNAVADVMGKQLLRSATSVGAHYREASRARSDAEFISKLEVAVQELDESSYWMELLAEARVFTEARLSKLRRESHELIAILTTCIKKVKARKRS